MVITILIIAVTILVLLVSFGIWRLVQLPATALVVFMTIIVMLFTRQHKD